jgi:hypothetical protein
VWRACCFVNITQNDTAVSYAGEFLHLRESLRNHGRMVVGEITIELCPRRQAKSTTQTALRTGNVIDLDLVFDLVLLVDATSLR